MHLLISAALGNRIDLERVVLMRGIRYQVEQYRDTRRFNEQYYSIYWFLLEAGKLPFNEHFHWGRFEWMHLHSMLEEEKLTRIAMFRDAQGKIVGLLTYDTFYDDRVYLIHTTADKELLNKMVDTACEQENGKIIIKVNSRDIALAEVLRERQFRKGCKDVSVLELDLREAPECAIAEGYSITPLGFVPDDWEYQMVIHRGFEHENVPEKWSDEVFARYRYSTGRNAVIQTFALRENEYCAHCGVWYTEGDTAYVEPVVTVPAHRNKGLARAVIYEACRRARYQGAERATVLSDEAFYHRIGFQCSSEVYCWERER